MAAAGRAQEGADRRERFDRLFDAHYVEVLAFALRRAPNRSEAEDIAAETFAVVWRRLQEVPDPPIPWLYGVAHGLLRNQSRSGRRRLRLTHRLAAERPELGRDPADAVEEREAAAVAFARLSPSQREVLQLVAWEGLNDEQGSAVLGCSAVAFRVRLHRARRELTKQLARLGHETGEGSADAGSLPQEMR